MMCGASRICWQICFGGGFLVEAIIFFVYFFFYAFFWFFYWIFLFELFFACSTFFVGEFDPGSG